MKLEPLDAANAGALEGLLAEPSLTSEFESIARPGGVVEELTDPHLDGEATRLAYVDGELAGFVMVFLLPFPEAAIPPRHWSLIRVGVGERFRRRGLATALLARAIGTITRPESPRPVDELTLRAWLPSEGAEALATGRGFHVARHFWLMERPLGGVAEPGWPAGVDTRTFDSSDRAFEDLTAIYNDSFAEHYHFVPGTVEDTRDLASGDLFRSDGLAKPVPERGADPVACLVWHGRCSEVGPLAHVWGKAQTRALALMRPVNAPRVLASCPYP